MVRKHFVNDCKLIQLPKIHNLAGNITPIENSRDIPFDIKRVYYLYDIPAGEERGAHGHKELEQIIIAASGSFDITLNDGIEKKTFTLNRPFIGLHVLPGMWREIHNFSSCAICLVLASLEYSEDDYFRDYNEFNKYFDR